MVLLAFEIEWPVRSNAASSAIGCSSRRVRPSSANDVHEKVTKSPGRGQQVFMAARVSNSLRYNTRFP
jgi:hypothetical protein